MGLLLFMIHDLYEDIESATSWARNYIDEHFHSEAARQTLAQATTTPMSNNLKISATFTSDTVPEALNLVLPYSPQLNAIEAFAFAKAAPSGITGVADAKFVAAEGGLELDVTVDEATSPALHEIFADKILIPLKTWLQKIAEDVFVGHDFKAEVTAVLA